MKIGGSYKGFEISSQGLSLQRKKMDVIAENIANSETTRTEDGAAYKRKFLKATSTQSSTVTFPTQNDGSIKLLTSNENHIRAGQLNFGFPAEGVNMLNGEILEDSTVGDMIFMPNHPDANEDGYIESSNVNIVNEMVQMIEATRTYDANLTALKASKDMAKDSLEI